MEMIKNLFSSRKLIFTLALNDFKTKYSGSIFGIFWAFVQPVVTIVVYWLIFAVGFKSGQDMDEPFVMYLICGIIPWFFFAEGLSGGASSLVAYTYLVKKVVFKVDIIPAVKIAAAFFVHLFFVAFTMVLCCLYGYYPSLYWIQIIYYMICTFVLVLGLSYIFAAITCFFRDMLQIINIVLQIGIWAVPIMYNVAIMPDSILPVLKFNPMYYIVFGYREAFYNKVWFWENWQMTIYFWIVSILILLIGVKVFKKLRPHFADVL